MKKAASTKSKTERNVMAEMKKREMEIRIRNFKRVDSKEFFASFTLCFRGLAIPNCGAFYTRKGQFDFEIPYQAHFSVSDKDSGEISEKLSIAFDEYKIQATKEIDVNESPF